MSTTSQLLELHRRTSISLQIIDQKPVTLGGFNFLVDFMVIKYTLEFNMLLGHDYVYCMQAVC